MAGIGPPPKPPGTRARRNASPQVTTLSATDRAGKKAPPWPLESDIGLTVRSQMAHEKREHLEAEVLECTDRRKLSRFKAELQKAMVAASVLDAQILQQAKAELELWAELWSTPQAAMWEKLTWSREVAQYVRWKVRGEMGDLDAAKEARQWSDRLGLNPLAMLRLRWEIERADEAEARGAQRRTRPTTPAKRGAVDPRRMLQAVK